MFNTIFTFELRYWFSKWQFYVYAAIAFLLAYVTVSAAGGAFDSNTVTVDSLTKINSPIGLWGIIQGLTTLLYFFLPAIFGTAISKDFTTHTHEVLYSYPFTKTSYFVAKYLSAFVITLLVMVCVGLGAFLGYITPGLNENMLGPNSLWPYLQIYLTYIIPNLLIFGTIIFILVSVTRNAAIGYIVVVLFLFQESLSGLLFEQLDNKLWGVLLDPFGERAMFYYTEYWTIDEQNTQPLPSGKYILFNRLLWVAISGAILGIFYRFFQLSQTTVSLFKRKAQSIVETPTRRKFGRPVELNMPNVDLRNDLFTHLNNVWQTARIHFLYILKNPAFITFALLGVLFLVIVFAFSGMIFQTETYPVTQNMLRYGQVFNLFIVILTFLMAGFLIDREKSSGINQLVDATPVSNAVQLAGKFLSIVFMQATLLLLIMVCGIAYQLISGFTDLNIGLYLFHLLVVKLLAFIPWIALAFLAHKLIPNKYVGFIALMVVYIGLSFLPQIGIEQAIYIYNEGRTNVSYSALDGYGHRFLPFFIYRSYWLLASMVLLSLAYFLWRRGYTYGVKERWNTFLGRIRGKAVFFLGLSLIGFLVLGYTIYKENNIKDEFVSSKERELERVRWEKEYKRYEDTQQPRITDVSVTLDLLPQVRSFSAKGKFTLVNKSDRPVDTLLLNYAGHSYDFDFGRNVDTLFRDEKLNFAGFKLEKGLMPGDSMLLVVSVRNKPNTLFRNKSGMYHNGTFLNSSIFPSLGYSTSGELLSDNVREKYDLPPKERMAPPTDTSALQNTYISSDADWVSFEATVSTDPDQIAIAPGYLQKEWENNGRRYFHYKMDVPMLNFYNFVSGRYAVLRDKWKDVNLEIYYHEDHDYNLDRMMDGLKQGFDYFTENFSLYQHRQLRIIEFPSHYGGFAQSFANTVPFSETVGFIAKVDDSEEGGVDYPFAITAHELAHQWWAHQVIGANVQGATLLSESLSEYSSLKVLEKKYGKQKMRIFLKDALDKYLMGRTMESKKEKPLMYNENQGYIHYNKGSLILYAISDYLGEDRFNQVLSSYIDSVGFQEAPYTTSLEFVGMIKEATPDSLQYLIRDMFETITLYNNRVRNAEYEELEGGKYKVKIKYQVRKYRASEQGKRLYADEGQQEYFEIENGQDTLKSIPLNDYVELGIFGEDDKELYLKKHKMTRIIDSVEIVVDEKPVAAGVDPYNKLIDVVSTDNRTNL